MISSGMWYLKSPAMITWICSCVVSDISATFKCQLTISLVMMDYRDRSDAEIASNFEQLCDDVLTQIGDQLYALTEEHVPLDEEIKDAMSCDEPLYDDWDVVRYMGEVGCPICRRGDTIFVGDLTPPCTGGGCNIRSESCARLGGEYVGSFHTHPVNGTTPSPADIETSIRDGEEIMCIGGNVGGKSQITCYTAKLLPRRRGIAVSIRGSYYPNFEDLVPDGQIKFYRETPPPTPGEVLEALLPNEDEIRHLIADSYHIGVDDEEMPELVEEFINTLKRGEMPDEYLEYYDYDQPSEGFEDTIDIYLGENSKKLEERYHEFLKRDLFLCKL